MISNLSYETEIVSDDIVYANIGDGPTFTPIDIGLSDQMALISPDTAFWCLIKKEKLSSYITDQDLLKTYQQHSKRLEQEMNNLRFHLKTTAVYFNPTDRCNLNCSYCYIPSEKRKDGQHMSTEQLLNALKTLKSYFSLTLPPNRLPEIIFHGAEPLTNKAAMFAGIEQYVQDFRFGIQTNGTLLEDEDITFLKSKRVAIGLSLDSHIEEIANQTRKTWDNKGIYKQVLHCMEKLKGYPNYSVICTATQKNMHQLPALVDFFHEAEVPACMLNPVRCTLSGAREIKPHDLDLAHYYLRALERSYELFKSSGRKLIIANFANVLLSIVAPTARKLMCDISPCGGGRSFFALSASGDLYPCSEFIGLSEFVGGNLFNIEKNSSEKETKAQAIKKDIDNIVFNSKPFSMVRGRRVEDIKSCQSCAIRHFCGSPCPAEAFTMNGGMKEKGAFCKLYEKQVQYAFKLVAENKFKDFLWDNWDKNLVSTFNYIQ